MPEANMVSRARRVFIDILSCEMQQPPSSRYQQGRLTQLCTIGLDESLPPVFLALPLYYSIRVFWSVVMLDRYVLLLTAQYSYQRPVSTCYHCVW